MTGVDTREKLEEAMAKFMVKASYKADGARGLIKEGGTARRDTVEKSVKALGGSLEAFYFAFGEADAYVIVDMPDVASGIALSLAVNASGNVHVSTIPLFSPAEMDAACKKSVSYRAPGA